jgi:hypothetical protein
MTAVGLTLSGLMFDGQLATSARRRPISNGCSTAEEELCALLESVKVEVVLFDKVAPRESNPSMELLVD